MMLFYLLAFAFCSVATASAPPLKFMYQVTYHTGPGCVGANLETTFDGSTVGFCGSLLPDPGSFMITNDNIALEQFTIDVFYENLFCVSFPPNITMAGSWGDCIDFADNLHSIRVDQQPFLVEVFSLANCTEPSSNETMLYNVSCADSPSGNSFRLAPDTSDTTVVLETHVGPCPGPALETSEFAIINSCHNPFNSTDSFIVRYDLPNVFNNSVSTARDVYRVEVYEGAGCSSANGQVFLATDIMQCLQLCGRDFSFEISAATPANVTFEISSDSQCGTLHDVKTIAYGACSPYESIYDLSYRISIQSWDLEFFSTTDCSDAPTSFFPSVFGSSCRVNNLTSAGVEIQLPPWEFEAVSLSIYDVGCGGNSTPASACLDCCLSDYQGGYFKVAAHNPTPLPDTCAKAGGLYRVDLFQDLACSLPEASRFEIELNQCFHGCSESGPSFRLISANSSTVVYEAFTDRDCADSAGSFELSPGSCGNTSTVGLSLDVAEQTYELQEFATADCSGMPQSQQFGLSFGVCTDFSMTSVSLELESAMSGKVRGEVFATTCSSLPTIAAPTDFMLEQCYPDGTGRYFRIMLDVSGSQQCMMSGDLYLVGVHEGSGCASSSGELLTARPVGSCLSVCNAPLSLRIASANATTVEYAVFDQMGCQGPSDMFAVPLGGCGPYDVVRNMSVFMTLQEWDVESHQEVDCDGAFSVAAKIGTDQCIAHFYSSVGLSINQPPWMGAGLNVSEFENGCGQAPEAVNAFMLNQCTPDIKSTGAWIIKPTIGVSPLTCPPSNSTGPTDIGNVDIFFGEDCNSTTGQSFPVVEFYQCLNPCGADFAMRINYVFGDGNVSFSVFADAGCKTTPMDDTVMAGTCRYVAAPLNFSFSVQGQPFEIKSFDANGCAGNFTSTVVQDQTCIVNPWTGAGLAMSEPVWLGSFPEATRFETGCSGPNVTKGFPLGTCVDDFEVSIAPRNPPLMCPPGSGDSNGTSAGSETGLLAIYIGAGACTSPQGEVTLVVDSPGACYSPCSETWSLKFVAMEAGTFTYEVYTDKNCSDFSLQANGTAGTCEQLASPGPFSFVLKQQTWQVQTYSSADCGGAPSTTFDAVSSGNCVMDALSGDALTIQSEPWTGSALYTVQSKDGCPGIEQMPLNATLGECYPFSSALSSFRVTAFDSANLSCTPPPVDPCAGGCDDMNNCTIDTCTASGCVYTPIMPSQAIIEGPFQRDIGCAQGLVLEAVAPTVGTGQWTVPGGGDVFFNSSSSPVVFAGSIMETTVLRWTVSYLSCGSTTAEVRVKRYDQVSDAVAFPTFQNVSCQSAFVLNATRALDGQGRWTRIAGNGFLTAQERSRADASVTSMSTLFNQFEWTVSAPSCASKSVRVTVARADPDSVECAGCQVVSLGIGEDGNETFVNTCDPPVATEVSGPNVRFEVPIVLKSLSVSKGGSVEISAEVEFTELVNLTAGSTLTLSGNASSVTMADLSASNSTLSLGAGSVVTVRGNLTSTGATFSVSTGNLTVEGSATFDDDTVFRINRNGKFKVGGRMGFKGLLQFLLELVFDLPGETSRRNTQTVVTESVVDYDSREGEFNAVEAAPTSQSCGTVSGAEASYGQQSMSVTVSVDTTQCDSGTTGASGGGGLSTGVIIGIAVGAAVVGALAILIIIIVCRRMQLKRTEEMFRARELGKSDRKSDRHSVQMQALKTRDDFAVPE